MRAASSRSQIDHHQEMGPAVIWPTLAMWLLAVALVLIAPAAAAGHAVKVVAVLAVLAAVAAATRRWRSPGHLGSTAVWSCTVGSDACK